MSTRLVNLVADAANPAASARWWAAALGWEITLEQPDEVAVEPPEPDGLGIPLVFVPVPDPKTTPTGSTSTWPAHQPPPRQPWSPASSTSAPPRSTSARARCPGRSWPTPRATSSNRTATVSGSGSPARDAAIAASDPQADAPFSARESGRLGRLAEARRRYAALRQPERAAARSST